MIRTFDNPIADIADIADIAEALVALRYDGTRGSFSQPSWDVRTVDERLLKVKALRRTRTRSRRNLSPVRSDGYDAVVVVIFTEDLRVEQAVSIPRAVVNELFAWRPHVAGRVITVTKKLLAHPEVETIALSDRVLDTPVQTTP